MAERIVNPYEASKYRFAVRIYKGKHQGNFRVPLDKETIALWILRKEEELLKRHGTFWDYYFKKNWG